MSWKSEAYSVKRAVDAMIRKREKRSRMLDYDNKPTYKRKKKVHASTKRSNAANRLRSGEERAEDQEYYPEDKQVVQSNLSEEEGDIDFLGLLRGTKGIQDNFVVEPATFPTENQNVHQLKLIPKRGDPET